MIAEGQNREFVISILIGPIRVAEPEGPGGEYFFPEPLGTKMLILPQLPKIA